MDNGLRIIVLQVIRTIRTDLLLADHGSFPDPYLTLEEPTKTARAEVGTPSKVQENRGNIMTTKL
jgi:hypothetical protein